jgi:hypothetical protein
VPRHSICVFLMLLLTLTGCVISPRRDIAPVTNGGGANFSLQASPSSQSIVAGNQTVYTITITPGSGFTGTVNLSINTGNAAVQAGVNPTAITGGSGNAELTVTTFATTATGTFTFQITGTDSTNGQTQTASVTLAVLSGSNPTTMDCMKTVPAGLQSKALLQPAAAGSSVSFSASPSVSPMNATVGLVSANAGFVDLVRFSPSGFLQVRNGQNFSADTSVPYVAGEAYQFRIVIDQTAATYSAFVTPPGQQEVMLGSDLSLPSEQTTMSFHSLGVLVDSAQQGEISVCNVVP